MIIAQIVGRNESSKYLKQILERLKLQVDMIVFTDDCSEDNTANIAAEYAEVYVNDQQLFTVDESTLRSKAWSNLSNHATEGDWVIAIDCDEMLYVANDIENLSIKKTLEYSPYDVVNVRFYHMWNKTHYRVDKLWAPNNSSRIFRFKNNGQFTNKKLACGSEPTYVLEDLRRRNYWVNSGLVMQHLGYTDDTEKQKKYDRYMAIDKGKFHNIQHIKSIIDPSPTLITWGNFGI